MITFEWQVPGVIVIRQNGGGVWLGPTAVSEIRDYLESPGHTTMLTGGIVLSGGTYNDLTLKTPDHCIILSDRMVTDLFEFIEKVE